MFIQPTASKDADKDIDDLPLMNLAGRKGLSL